METEYLKFSGTDALRSHAASLDVAEPVTLYYKDAFGNVVEVPGSKGVMNTSKGYYVATVSDGYSILQNSEMVKMVADALDQLNIQPEGKIVNDHHKVSLELFFPDFSIEEINHNKPVYMGSRIVNSYNKSSGFKGHGFLHRVWCSNGAYASHALPEMVFSEVHRGDLDVRAVEILNGYMVSMGSAMDKIGTVLQIAAESEVKFAEGDQIIATLGRWAGSKRAGKEIFRHLNKEVPEDEMDVSRYDLWNAFTSFASHEPGLSTNVRDRINKVAEQILYPSSKLEVEENYKEYLNPVRKPRTITVEPVIVA